MLRDNSQPEHHHQLGGQAAAGDHDEESKPGR